MANKFNETLELSTIEKKFFQICNDLLPNEGYGIYDLRYLTGSSTLRVFITKNSDVKNIGITDCVKVDKLISSLIDEAEWIPDNFVLEVSSPGVYRDIRNSDQLKYSVNDLLKIKFNSHIDNDSYKNKQVVGTLLNYNNDELEMNIEGKNIVIKYESIKSVNAEIEF